MVINQHISRLQSTENVTLDKEMLKKNETAVEAVFFLAAFFC